ncbi:MAG: hypothetical protein JM58_16375 [Peptococcaceae bacterium BICA1-8]|nr:MAG: hypothetical protein JM58_16375 [Peptococcaceae bacterium BICA1-8]
MEELLDKGTGALLSPYDPRVYPAQAIFPVEAESTPDIYESPRLRVTNQKNVGRCVSEAIGNCVEEFIFEETGEFVPVSRDFFYQNRKLGQYFGSGMYTSEALDNLRHDGYALESVMPDVMREFDPSIGPKFSENVRQNAVIQKALTTARARSLTEVQNAIWRPKTACVLVIPIYNSFIFHTTINPQYKPGVLPLPGAKETIQGYHLIKYHAHNRPKKTFTIKNSWDVEHGEEGYTELPENYPVAEWWIITDFAPLYDKLTLFIETGERIFNGKLLEKMDADPLLQGGRTFTPTRHTHSPFGDVVKYDDKTKTVEIMRPRVPVKVGV